MILGFVLGAVTTTAQDTDYVLLQANPFFHWVPVNDEAETSDDSSHDSTDHLHRTNSQRSIASQRSIRSSCSQGHRSARRNGSTTNSRPSSLFVSPPPSPRPAFRSKSTDENYTGNNIPLKATCSTTSIKKRRSASTLNDEIVLTVPTVTTVATTVTTNSSLEKLTKLKDRIIGTVAAPNIGGESDDESTPLVSEISTPTHSQSDSVFRNEYSHESSSDMSPASNKSLPRDGERSLDIDYSDTISLMIRESSVTRSLPRQNAEDWDNPETPV